MSKLKTQDFDRWTITFLSMSLMGPYLENWQQNSYQVNYLYTELNSIFFLKSRSLVFTRKVRVFNLFCLQLKVAHCLGRLLHGQGALSFFKWILSWVCTNTKPNWSQKNGWLYFIKRDRNFYFLVTQRWNAFKKVF